MCQITLGKIFAFFGSGLSNFLSSSLVALILSCCILVGSEGVVLGPGWNHKGKFKTFSKQGDVGKVHQFLFLWVSTKVLSSKLLSLETESSDENWYSNFKYFTFSSF